MKRRIVLMLLTVILILTAAAFAGCRTLTPEEGYALLTEAYDNYVAEISDKFQHKFGKAPRIIEVNISQGAHRIE